MKWNVHLRAVIGSTPVRTSRNWPCRFHSAWACFQLWQQNTIGIVPLIIASKKCTIDYILSGRIISPQKVFANLEIDIYKLWEFGISRTQTKQLQAQQICCLWVNTQCWVCLCASVHAIFNSNCPVKLRKEHLPCDPLPFFFLKHNKVQSSKIAQTRASKQTEATKRADC